MIDLDGCVRCAVVCARVCVSAVCVCDVHAMHVCNVVCDVYCRGCCAWMCGCGDMLPSSKDGMELLRRADCRVLIEFT